LKSQLFTISLAVLMTATI